MHFYQIYVPFKDRQQKVGIPSPTQAVESVTAGKVVHFLNITFIAIIKGLTVPLQEFVHKLIKCPWIVKESSHLVEVVWRHNDILGVSHDIYHL